MNKKANKTQAGTNIEEVSKQNAQSAGGQGNFGAEFGSETDAQEVKQQNQQAESQKAKNSGNFGQQ